MVHIFQQIHLDPQSSPTADFFFYYRNNYFDPSVGLIRRWCPTNALSFMTEHRSDTDFPAIVVFLS